MLDRIHMFVPFQHSAIVNGEAGQHVDSILTVDLSSLGVPLSGAVNYDDDGLPQVDSLRHPWESLSTGFTPLAFKIFHQSSGMRRMPGIELKASPAKLLQGHNVFGPTCIQKGAEVMFMWLAGAYPKLFAQLDVSNTQVYSIDCTYSARLPNEKTALQVIQSLSGVTNGQTKGRGDNYQTTCYWGAKESRLKRLKAYLKHTEFEQQLEDYKRARRSDLSAARCYKVISDPRLIEWTKYLLRFEATVMHRWLERRGVPSRLVDLIAHQKTLAEQGRCFIQECWQAVTKDIFAAFEGLTMRVIDDEKVLAALIAKHTRISKSGKRSDAYARNLFRTFRSIKEFGWTETFESMGRASFYNHVRDICSAGLSKATLQKLQEHDRSNNVVPLLRFVQVDFSAQRPDWYVEPSVEAA